MNRKELLKRLEGTEWIDFEVKSARGGVPEDAFKTLSAFANSGAWLVFGLVEGGEGYEIEGIFQRTATVLWWRDRVDFYNPGDSYVATSDLWAGGFSETRNPPHRPDAAPSRPRRTGGQRPAAHPAHLGGNRAPDPELRNDKGRKRFEMSFLWGEPVFERSEPVNGPAEPVNEPVNEPVRLSAEAPLSERVLRLLIDQPGLRVPEIVARLNTTRSSAKRALKTLKADGRVTFRGAPKTGGYHPTSRDDEKTVS